MYFIKCIFIFFRKSTRSRNLVKGSVLMIFLTYLGLLVDSHRRALNHKNVRAIPTYGSSLASGATRSNVMCKRSIQTRPLIHSVLDLDERHLVLFAYDLPKQKIMSCLINGISVPWATIDYNSFKCLKTKTIDESDVLSIQTMGGQVVPSIVQWKDRMKLTHFSNALLSLCIITMVKNEGPRIEDWIKYHIRQGVESFIIYENNSSDNTAAVIQKYKEVTIIDWPWHKTKQEAYVHGIILARDVCQWALFIDVDEYVFPTENKASHSVQALLTYFPYWLNAHVQIKDRFNINQICFDTKVMGSSQFIKCPNVTLPEGFIHFDEWWYKTTGKCAIRPHESLLKHFIHRFEVNGGTFVLPRSSAHLVHYKYQCWEYFMTKWDKGRSSRQPDWDKTEINKSRPVNYFTKKIGPIDTVFRDYKRKLDMMPLEHIPPKRFKGNKTMK